jgi:hypothetical protein
MALAPHTINCATEALVRMMWREFQRRYPGKDNPVPFYNDMRPIDRQSWERCAAAAVEAAKEAEKHQFGA